MITNKRICYLIQLESCYTRLYIFRQFTKGLTNKLISSAHQLYLIFRLQKYLHTDLVCRHSDTATSMNTARIKQAIVVTHEQMALNLLECVKHNTNENQQ